MPEICAVCGAATSRSQDVYAEYEERDDAEPHWGWFGLGPLGAILNAQLRKKRAKKKGCVIYLRVCNGCSSIPITPVRVHFRERQMQFVVHTSFKEAFAALQQRYRGT
jgi:hypothetical protein